jgi:hypothetical protein
VKLECAGLQRVRSSLTLCRSIFQLEQGILE